MDRSYWSKQTDKPLFPDLLWSRPEHKAQAGKLLIIGGNAHGFSAAAEAYNAAVNAQIGTAHVLLPDAIRKIVKAILETADYAPSTPSGSFSQKALTEFILHSNWADGVLLAGDLGRNSETAMVLETFVSKYAGQLTITKDAIDYFTSSPDTILSRSETTLVLSLAQLQKLAIHVHMEHALTFDMDLLRVVEWLHAFTTRYASNIVVKHLDTIFVASAGRVSSTKSTKSLEENWRVPTASHTAVWWLQNPSKTFESLTTAVVDIN